MAIGVNDHAKEGGSPGVRTVICIAAFGALLYLRKISGR
jgi:hypothetical protein